MLINSAPSIKGCYHMILMWDPMIELIYYNYGLGLSPIHLNIRFDLVNITNFDECSMWFENIHLPQESRLGPISWGCSVKVS